MRQTRASHRPLAELYAELRRPAGATQVSALLKALRRPQRSCVRCIFFFPDCVGHAIYWPLREARPCCVQGACEARSDPGELGGVGPAQRGPGVGLSLMPTSRLPPSGC